MNLVPVPRTLDAQPRFLFWDLDYVCIAAVGFAAGLIVATWFWGTAAAAVLCMAWARARAGGGTAAAFAALFWHLPFDVFIRVPASARRHFIG